MTSTQAPDQPAHRVQRLSLGDMARRAASEFREGMVVNLGTGMPTACSEVVPDDMEVFFHSEQGVLGFGAVAKTVNEADPYLINASRQCVLRKPGMVFMDHSDSFALARGGRVDITVIGALEVSQSGDLANCRLNERPSGLIGGGQDFAFCARRVIVMMKATGSSGQPKLVSKCTLPLTAPGVVDLIVTEVGVFEPTGSGFLLKEIAAGVSVSQVQEYVHASLQVADPLPLLGAGGR